MSTVVKLHGSNKKLLHQSGNYIKRANKAADNDNWDLFKVLSKAGHKKINLVAKRLNVDTNKFLVAPNLMWDSLVLIEK